VPGQGSCRAERGTLPTVAPSPAFLRTTRGWISTRWHDALEQSPGLGELRWFESPPAALDFEQSLTGGAKQCADFQHGAHVLRDRRRRPDSGVDLLDVYRDFHVSSNAPLAGSLAVVCHRVPTAHRQPPGPQHGSAGCVPGARRPWIRRSRRRPSGRPCVLRATLSYSANALRLPTDRLSRPRASSTLVLVAGVVEPGPSGRRV
jgi:hypothetical protein